MRFFVQSSRILKEICNDSSVQFVILDSDVIQVRVRVGVFLLLLLLLVLYA